MSLQPRAISEQPVVGVRQTLILAGVVGMVTGLVEGVALLVSQHYQWLTHRLAQVAVAADILWISAVTDGLLFATAGVLLSAILAPFRHLDRRLAVVFTFALLLFYDWLVIVDRMRHFAMAILALGLAAMVTRALRRNPDIAFRFCRRMLPWCAATVAVVFVGLQTGHWLSERRAMARLPAAAPGTPNVLIILVDALRADHVSAYGYPRATTPAVDRVAREGVLFEKAFSPSAWTLPSHASLLTGRYPHEHHAQTVRDRLDRRFETLGEALQTEGYRTAGFSGNTFWFNRRVGLGRGFIHFEDYFTSARDMLGRTIFGREFDLLVLQKIGAVGLVSGASGDILDRHILRWIDRDRRRPFFVFVNYFDVHERRSREEVRQKFSGKPPVPIDPEMFRVHPQAKEEAIRDDVNSYDASLADVDEHIGDLLEELGRCGLADDTIVVITSDHGELFSLHGLSGHGNSLYRHVIQVPLILRWPQHLPAGMRVGTPVGIRRLAATILDLIHDRTSTLPGPSLALAWQHNGDEASPPAVSELAREPFKLERHAPAYSESLTSIITPDWHLILGTKQQPELYDFRRDPNEHNNLAQTPRGQAAIHKLMESVGSVGD